ASLVATHVMKMMAHRQRRRMSLASVAWGDSSAATRVTALMWDRLQVSDSLPSHAPGTRLARTTTFATSTRAREQQADKLFRKIIEIADDASGVYVTTSDGKRTASRRCSCIRRTAQSLSKRLMRALMLRLSRRLGPLSGC